MGYTRHVVLILAVSLVLRAKASLTIPGEMISPLGIPGAMGPAGMNAVKLAVASRLLTMLGTGGMRNPSLSLGSPFSTQGLYGSGLLGLPPITSRSKEFTRRRGPSIPTSFDIRTATATEVENFFAVLHKVDANECISRLVCEVGAEPNVLKDLGHNIKDVMSSLQVLEKNALSSKYRKILLKGQKEGLRSCTQKYSTCDQRSYRLVRTFVRAFKVKN